MSQLLTLTRAARLVGVTRGALQKKIRNGELATFEGMVAPEDLLSVYPKTDIEGSAVLERMEKIKDEAFFTRLRERIMPDAEVLSARLNKLSREHGRIQALLDRYKSLYDRLDKKLGDAESKENDQLPSELTSLRSWLRHELEQAVQSEFPDELAVEDNFLRLMAAHVAIRSSAHEFFVEGNDNILDAALRSGLALNYGCSNGSCGLCKANILSGQTKKTRHHDYKLTPEEEQTGVVLLCSNTAVTDLVIDAPEARSAKDISDQSIQAGVKGIKRLSEDMMVLRLHTPPSHRLRFLAGQSVWLRLDNGLKTDHPVASCPCDEGNLQFHIQRTPANPFSEFLFNKLTMDEKITVMGPQGDFRLKEDSLNPIIFLAYETGFAPIRSMIEHAMALEVAESMHLYWVTNTESGHYLHNLCRSWDDALDNFRYTPLMAKIDPLSTAKAAVAEVRRYEIILEETVRLIASNHAALSDYDVYIAGAESIVMAAKNLLIAQGLPKAQVFTGNLHQH